MSSNIFSKMQESKIFKNETALSPEYLPDFLPHRETQIQEIARVLNPITKWRKPQNVFISGSPGIGKTCVSKFVLNELGSFNERVRTVYVNTWDYNTSASLLTKIIVGLGGFIPRRGLSKDEIMEKFIELVKKSRNAFMICLDEVDQLIKKDPSALYNLLRIDQYVENPIGLVMISNYDEILFDLEPRIRSSLNVEKMAFKPYKLDEMKKILSERSKEAFRPGVLEDGVILIAANQAVKKNGDVRIGLQCLQRASRIAEKEGSEKILVKHVKDSLKESTNLKLFLMKERLVGPEKNVMELLEEDDGLPSTELKESYCKRFGDVSQTTFRKYVVDLENKGLVKVEETRADDRGRKYIISLVREADFK
jgi:cell division control protein 6